MMIPDWLAWAGLWASTFLWCLIALVALWDSVKSLGREGYRRRIARAFGNGRRVVAEGRHDTAQWFVVGFAATLGVGVLAAFTLSVQFFTPAFSRPDPQYSLTTAAIRACFLVVIFGLAIAGPS
jgi:hypothetical protein